MEKPRSRGHTTLPSKKRAEARVARFPPLFSVLDSDRRVPCLGQN